MRKTFLVSIFICSFLLSVGDTIPENKSTIRFNSDTLKLQNIDSPKKKNLGDQMPWVVALTIGILSIGVSYIISRNNRKVLERQMVSNEKQAMNNIENAKQLAIFEFTKTLNSKNKQEWINDVRENISNLTSFAKLLNIEFNESVDVLRRKGLMEKLTYHRTKLFLLLSTNPKKETHTSLILSIKDFFTTLDQQLHANFSKHRQSELNLEFFNTSENLIETGRKLLYEEWQTIQAVK